MFLILLSACNVHEWPNTPKLVTLCLRLSYKTDMTELYHQYNGAEVIFKEKGETYDNQLESGRIRYIIHAYPQTGKQGEIQEFLFEKDIKSENLEFSESNRKKLVKCLYTIISNEREKSYLKKLY